MITTIVRKSAPWDKHTMLDLMNVGFTDEFKLHLPMERVKARTQSEADKDAIQQRLNIHLWPWQARCACGAVRDKQELKAHGGQCEKCRPAETRDPQEGVAA
ncbi:MAG: hypothetical protein LLG01_00660 [Planctomycetaceae bacterium]|nr:hypothetical protein [Planctomycetaceae bacterium]